MFTGSARDQLLDEVKKLKELTSGQIKIKATAELEYMDADSLLSYAQDVATDLDVRRQTFDEGLKASTHSRTIMAKVMSVTKSSNSR